MYWIIIVRIIVNAEKDLFGTAKYGHINVAQWLYSFGDVNIHADERAHLGGLVNGLNCVAQWLYSLAMLVFVLVTEYAFKMISGRWISLLSFSSSIINIRDDERTFWMVFVK